MESAIINKIFLTRQRYCQPLAESFTLFTDSENRDYYFPSVMLFRSRQMAEDLIQTMRPRQKYVMSNNDNDGKLADTIYIICWGVDEPTLYAIFSKSFLL